MSWFSRLLKPKQTEYFIEAAPNDYFHQGTEPEYNLTEKKGYWENGKWVTTGETKVLNTLKMHQICELTANGSIDKFPKYHKSFSCENYKPPPASAPLASGQTTSAPPASIQLNLVKKAEYEAACRKCEEGRSQGLVGGRNRKQRTRRVIRRQKRQTKRKNRS